MPDTLDPEERGDEIRFRSNVREKEQEQSQHSASRASNSESTSGVELAIERDFEGGFGWQEDLEDRYATTSGDH